MNGERIQANIKKKKLEACRVSILKKSFLFPVFLLCNVLIGTHTICDPNLLIN